MGFDFGFHDGMVHLLDSSLSLIWQVHFLFIAFNPAVGWYTKKCDFLRVVEDDFLYLL